MCSISTNMNDFVNSVLRYGFVTLCKRSEPIPFQILTSGEF
jgi:hypothetical protein